MAGFRLAKLLSCQATCRIPWPGPKISDAPAPLVPVADCCYYLAGYAYNLILGIYLNIRNLPEICNDCATSKILIINVLKRTRIAWGMKAFKRLLFRF